MIKVLDKDLIKHLQNLFLGKRISVEDKNGMKFAGVCKFIGYNEFFPSWELQVTIDRTPVPNAKISSIKLVEDTRLFKNGK